MNKKMKLVAKKHRKNRERLKRIKLAIMSAGKKTKSDEQKKVTSKAKKVTPKVTVKKVSKKTTPKKSDSKKTSSKKPE